MRRTIALIPSLVLALSLSACSGGTTRVTARPMPEGGTYNGVWHSIQYGEMHFCQNGNTVIGEYFKENRHGMLQGTADGNLLRFEWSEEREMIRGRPTVTRGQGYFQLLLDDGDGQFKLLGRWGHDDNDNDGGEWNAVFLPGRSPTRCYESVRRTSGATDPDADDWGDDESSEDDLDF